MISVYCASLNTTITLDHFFCVENPKVETLYLKLQNCIYYKAQWPKWHANVTSWCCHHKKKAFVKLLVVQKGALLQIQYCQKSFFSFKSGQQKIMQYIPGMNFFFSSHLISDTMPTLKCIIYQTCWIPEKNYTFLTLQVHTTNKEGILSNNELNILADFFIKKFRQTEMSTQSE